MEILFFCHSKRQWSDQNQVFIHLFDQISQNNKVPKLKRFSSQTLQGAYFHKTIWNYHHIENTSIQHPNFHWKIYIKNVWII